MTGTVREQRTKRKVQRKRAAYTAAQQAGASQRALRHLKRSYQRSRQHWVKQRSKRTFQILAQVRRKQAQVQQRHKAWKQGLKFATWNTRGLGARQGAYAPELKIKCFIQRMIRQNWGGLVLTDVKGETETREFKVAGRIWTLIVRGRIGFLLEDVWTEWWRSGGSRTYASGDRVCGLQLPRQGWRRGLYLVGVYAPTSDVSAGERQTLRTQVSEVLHMAHATSTRVVLGDFNAEMGNNQDPHQPGAVVMGRFGHPKLTVAGAEWRAWAEREEYIHCHSRYQHYHRWTWKHPRYHSEHELDHVFLDAHSHWHLQNCRTLQEGPSVDWPWTDYTDHNPVEVKLRHGKLWHTRRKQQVALTKPDVKKLRGQSEEAAQLREQWVAQVEEQLARFRTTVGHTTPNQNWEQICNICRDTAVQVCGVLEQAQGQPWLQGKEQEIRLLDQIIAQARQEDKRVRQNADRLPPAQLGPLKQRKRAYLNEVRNMKRNSLQQWEEQWMNEKADAADQAATQGRMGSLFQIIRELSQAKEHRKRFGLRRSDNPQQEAEDWKEHFRIIQEGVGNIPDEVWQDITPQGPPVQWLNSPPTHEEFTKAIRDMSCGKAPGADQFMTEYLKIGGPVLLAEVFAVVTTVWDKALRADPGQEAESWPVKWKEGIIFPLWKRKGERHNKNNWRGITLLSVGSKLVARICAARLQYWSRTWLNPLQFGFKKGSGIDDVQQITRTILEEAAGSIHEKVVLLRFFDLEKAYPKVCRPGLWKLLEVKGCPAEFLRVLKAVHDHTASAVRFEGSLSTSFLPERGLRAGCPSSPILFNIYHSGMLEVFRARRLRAAEAKDLIPGIVWDFKVDGKIGKRRMDRLEEGRNVKSRVIGDFAYADDTGIVGEAEEAVQAEEIFALTVSDFAGKINRAKTEGLRVTADTPPGTNVPFLGENM